MKAPHSKKPKRFEHKVLKPLSLSGHYVSGIAVDEFCLALGAIAALWPHVEEAMISILSDLLYDEWVPWSRQLFRSIVSQNARITIMRTLLEESERNRDKEMFYDEVIKEFESLNKLRNRYLHGIWWTFQDGTVYLAESGEHFGIHKARRVKINDLKSVVSRMDELTRKVIWDRPNPTTAGVF